MGDGTGSGLGIYMFDLKVVENMAVHMPDTMPKNQNIVRIGCSLPLNSLLLGDSKESWGWGSTGEKSSNNRYAGYDGPFLVGDTVGSFMDADIVAKNGSSYLSVTSLASHATRA